jgi:phosphatidylglycerophosphate synthase
MATDRPNPHASLLTSVLLTDAFGCTAVALAGIAAKISFDLSTWYPLKAVVLFSAVMLVVIGGIGGTHPFDRLGPANQVTALRATIVSLIGSLVGEASVPAAAVAASAAGILVTALDGLDGWIARRSGMASPFGARFDMEVDALLILTLSILTWQYGKAGGWIVLGGLLRYFFVAAGWLAPWLARPLDLSRRRKAICILQITGLSALILPAVPPSMSVPAAAVLLAALSWSFVVDVEWLWRTR